MTWPREIDWPQVLIGTALGLAGTALAVVVKTRCGLFPEVGDAFLRLCYSDVPGLWTAERLHEGAVPYLDHPVEYPPLTGLWMWLAAVGAETGGEFVVRTYGLLLVAGAAIGGILGQLVGPRRSLVFAAAPSLVVAGAINWDLPSIALAMAGILAHRRGRDGWAGVWLGLGTAAKLWPVLLVLPVTLAAWSLRGRIGALRSAGGAAGAWLVVNVPLLLVAPTGWARFLELSTTRDPIEGSLWRLVLDGLGATPSIGTINAASAALTLLGCAAVMVVALRRDRPEQWHLTALPLVAVFLLAGKVWSPQFTLWLLPLLAIAMPPVWLLGALAVTDVAVHLTLFPHLGGLLGLTPPTSDTSLDLAVAARAVVVAAVAWSGWRRGATSPVRVPGGAS